jgi:predicted DNA-binding protein with PD1-like motif
MLVTRLGPGTEVIDELLDILATSPHAGLTVVSAAGSVDLVQYAMAHVSATGATTYTRLRRSAGPIELLALSGHVGRTDKGEGAGHIHAAFAEQDGTVVGGHVFQARVLGTVEITLMAGPSLGWVAHPVLHEGICSTTHVLSPAEYSEVTYDSR